MTEVVGSPTKFAATKELPGKTPTDEILSVLKRISSCDDVEAAIEVALDAAWQVVEKTKTVKKGAATWFEKQGTEGGDIDPKFSDGIEDAHGANRPEEITRLSFYSADFVPSVEPWELFKDIAGWKLPTDELLWTQETIDDLRGTCEVLVKHHSNGFPDTTVIPLYLYSASQKGQRYVWAVWVKAPKRNHGVWKVVKATELEEAYQKSTDGRIKLQPQWFKQVEMHNKLPNREVVMVDIPSIPGSEKHVILKGCHTASFFGDHFFIVRYENLARGDPTWSPYHETVAWLPPPSTSSKDDFQFDPPLSTLPPSGVVEYLSARGASEKQTWPAEEEKGWKCTFALGEAARMLVDKLFREPDQQAFNPKLYESYQTLRDGLLGDEALRRAKDMPLKALLASLAAEEAVLQQHDVTTSYMNAVKLYIESQHLVTSLGIEGSVVKKLMDSKLGNDSEPAPAVLAHALELQLLMWTQPDGVENRYLLALSGDRRFVVNTEQQVVEVQRLNDVFDDQIFWQLNAAMRHKQFGTPTCLKVNKEVESLSGDYMYSAPPGWEGDWTPWTNLETRATATYNKETKRWSVGTKEIDPAMCWLQLGSYLLPQVQNLVYYIDKALNKLMKLDDKPKTYRGLKNVSLSRSIYDDNKVVLWSAYSSSTSDRGIASSFARDKGRAAVFSLSGLTCVNISQWSRFGRERELLFPPNTTFQVQSALSEEQQEILGTTNLQLFSMAEVDQFDATVIYLRTVVNYVITNSEPEKVPRHVQQLFRIMQALDHKDMDEALAAVCDPQEPVLATPEGAAVAKMLVQLGARTEVRSKTALNKGGPDPAILTLFVKAGASWDEATGWMVLFEERGRKHIEELLALETSEIQERAQLDFRGELSHLELQNFKLDRIELDNSKLQAVCVRGLTGPAQHLNGAYRLLPEAQAQELPGCDPKRTYAQVTALRPGSHATLSRDPKSDLWFIEDTHMVEFKKDLQLAQMVEDVEMEDIVEDEGSSNGFWWRPAFQERPTHLTLLGEWSSGNSTFYIVPTVLPQCVEPKKWKEDELEALRDLADDDEGTSVITTELLSRFEKMGPNPNEIHLASGDRNLVPLQLEGFKPRTISSTIKMGKGTEELWNDTPELKPGEKVRDGRSHGGFRVGRPGWLTGHSVCAVLGTYQWSPGLDNIRGKISFPKTGCSACYFKRRNAPDLEKLFFAPKKTVPFATIRERMKARNVLPSFIESQEKGHKEIKRMENGLEKFSQEKLQKYLDRAAKRTPPYSVKAEELKRCTILAYPSPHATKEKKAQLAARPRLQESLEPLSIEMMVHLPTTLKNSSATRLVYHLPDVLYRVPDVLYDGKCVWRGVYSQVEYNKTLDRWLLRVPEAEKRINELYPELLEKEAAAEEPLAELEPKDVTVLTSEHAPLPKIQLDEDDKERPAVIRLTADQEEELEKELEDDEPPPAHINSIMIRMLGEKDPPPHIPILVKALLIILYDGRSTVPRDWEWESSKQNFYNRLETFNFDRQTSGGVKELKEYLMSVEDELSREVPEYWEERVKGLRGYVYASLKLGETKCRIANINLNKVFSVRELGAAALGDVRMRTQPVSESRVYSCKYAPFAMSWEWWTPVEEENEWKWKWETRDKTKRTKSLFVPMGKRCSPTIFVQSREEQGANGEYTFERTVFSGDTLKPESAWMWAPPIKICEWKRGTWLISYDSTTDTWKITDKGTMMLQSEKAFMKTCYAGLSYHKPDGTLAEHTVVVTPVYYLDLEASKKIPRPPTGQAISISVGQFGVQMGDMLWKLYCLDHGIEGRVKVKGEHEKWERGGYGDHMLFKTDSKGNKRARAVFIDTDPLPLDKLLRLGPDVIDPVDVVYSYETPKTFTDAFKGCKDTFNLSLDAIRLQLEECDLVLGFHLMYGVGGATGGGIGQQVLNFLHDDMPKVPKHVFSILPSKLDTCIAAYNYVLAAGENHTGAMSIMMQNAQIYKLLCKNLRLVRPSFADINEVIANVINSTTTCLRFDAKQRTDMTGLTANMVPYKPLHTVIPSFVPVIRGSFKMNATKLVADAMSSPLVGVDLSKGKALSTALLVRSETIQDCEVAVAKKRSLHLGEFVVQDDSSGRWEGAQRMPFQFVDFCPNGIMSNLTTAVGPKQLLNLVQRPSVMTTLTAHTSIVQAIEAQAHVFDMAFARRSFVHHFGEDAGPYFSEARETIASMVKDYEEVGTNTCEAMQEEMEEFY